MPAIASVTPVSVGMTIIHFGRSSIFIAWSDYDPSDNENPRGNPGGSSRVLRGGSFSFDTSSLRGSYRDGFVPGFVYDRNGFRVAWPGGQ